jgi:hypothetical protein
MESSKPSDRAVLSSIGARRGVRGWWADIHLLSIVGCRCQVGRVLPADLNDLSAEGAGSVKVGPSGPAAGGPAGATLTGSDPGATGNTGCGDRRQQGCTKHDANASPINVACARARQHRDGREDPATALQRAMCPDRVSRPPYARLRRAMRKRSCRRRSDLPLVPSMRLASADDVPAFGETQGCVRRPGWVLLRCFREYRGSRPSGAQGECKRGGALMWCR